ncbi:integrase core domain-containing protein [Flavisolibacter ginsenosidimutans]
MHGKLMRPQTQGRIERCHRSLKKVIQLDHYYCPEELNQELKSFKHYHNYQRYHELLDNVTPANVYFEKREQNLKRREKTKSKPSNKEDDFTFLRNND